MPTPPPASPKDGLQVLRYAFDDPSGTIRTTATIAPGGADLEIHYEDDSIAIGDPNSNNILSINPDGSANVLNVGQLIPKEFDSIGITNTIIAGDTVPSVIKYYTGGLSGSLVATLTLGYDGSANLTSVVRT